MGSGSRACMGALLLIGSVFCLDAAAQTTSVTWSVTQGSVGGTISPTGTYTAPSTAGTYDVVATSSADPALSAVAAVTVSASTSPASGNTPAALYAGASSTCAGMPLRSTGTIYYFCDCQGGAQSGCVAGNDANAGTSPSAPKQSWSAAIAAFNAMNAGDTVALCKGGAWAAAANASLASCSYAVLNARCAAGTSLTDPANTSTCDLRDYAPPWGGTAKPLVTANGALSFLSRQSATTNGVRILNLTFRGTNGGPRSGVIPEQRGILIGACGPTTGVTDSSWLFCNDTYDHLRLGIQGPQYGTASNFLVRGNTFTMNDLDGVLGVGNGANNSIDANVFDNNGGYMTSYAYGAHSLYLTPLSSTGFGLATNTSVVNNQFLRSAAASTTPGTCATPPLVSHGQFTTLNLENNLVDMGPSAGAGCWGISFNAANSDNSTYRGMTVRRNAVLNVTGEGITIGQAPGAIIENNVVRMLPTTTWNHGIVSPFGAARAGKDAVQNNTTIRNNTIYMTGSGAANGIVTGAEGTGHVVANNAIYSTTGRCIWTTLGRCSVTTTQQCDVDRDVDAQGVPLPLCPSGETCVEDGAAYTAVTNNSCYGGATQSDNVPPAANQLTTNPLFPNAPTDFTPAAGSPLVGAGNPAYAPSTDFVLKTRPNPPSIGAYEP